MPVYKSLVKPLLFHLDAERAHHVVFDNLRRAARVPGTKTLMRALYDYQNPNLAREVFGLKFSNPVGLAAGFDKNAALTDELATLGFSFVEIGTVTPRPQPGNPAPRLFRLPQDEALLNRMGFNNDGASVVAARLARRRNRQLIIGGNIGKNKVTPNVEAWKDYEICFKELHTYVDYFVVNVSSPNTPGLRELQEKESLRKILSHLQTINASQQKPKPLLLKIAPDLTLAQIDDVIDLSLEIKLDGLVAANTTISRSGLTTHDSRLTTISAGGLSGLPLKNKSTEIVRYIYQKTKGQIPIVASGGVFTGEDAKEKLEAGASLVQVWTGLIYEGPGIVKKICSSLN